jgi:hypothetical protein
LIFDSVKLPGTRPIGRGFAWWLAAAQNSQNRDDDKEDCPGGGNHLVHG